MKYLLEYNLLLEKVEDDNLLMEISKVLSQRLLEHLIVKFYDSNYSDIFNNLEDVQFYLPFRNDKYGISKYGISKIFVDQVQNNIKSNIYKDFIPKYNKMSDKAFILFKKLLEYSANKYKNHNAFLINLRNNKSAKATYYIGVPKISVSPSKFELDSFKDKIIGKYKGSIINSGVIINNKYFSSLFHEIRHWFDDYKSNTKAFNISNFTIDKSKSNNWGEYISQPHEISAWTSQFIQEVKLGINSAANSYNVTFDTPDWNMFIKAINTHFQMFYGVEKKVKNNIISKISKEWIKHQKTTQKHISNKIKKIEKTIKSYTFNNEISININQRVLHITTSGKYAPNHIKKVKSIFNQIVHLSNLFQLQIIIFANFGEEMDIVSSQFDDIYKEFGFNEIDPKDINYGKMIDNNYALFIYYPNDRSFKIKNKLNTNK